MDDVATPISVIEEDGVYCITGDTYPYRKAIKCLNGKWHPVGKQWRVAKAPLFPTAASLQEYILNQEKDTSSGYDSLRAHSERCRAADRAIKRMAQEYHLQKRILQAKVEQMTPGNELEIVDMVNTLRARDGMKMYSGPVKEVDAAFQPPGTLEAEKTVGDKTIRVYSFNFD